MLKTRRPKTHVRHTEEEDENTTPDVCGDPAYWFAVRRARLGAKEPALTLITCDAPRADAPFRLLVFCRLTESSPH